jgi:hypothetical protein
LPSSIGALRIKVNGIDTRPPGRRDEHNFRSRAAFVKTTQTSYMG